MPAQLVEVTKVLQRQRRSLSVTLVGIPQKGRAPTREDFWECQKILDGTKGSLRKACKCQTEASDKLWDMNRETERALDTLTLLYERIVQVNSDFAKVDTEFVREFAG